MPSTTRSLKIDWSNLDAVIPIARDLDSVVVKYPDRKNYNIVPHGRALDDGVEIVWEPGVRITPTDPLELLIRAGHKGGVECGRHSGFPDCCIAWFLGRYASWSLAPIPARRQSAYLRRCIKARITPGYIPCPACLSSGAFRQVKIKKCPPSCRLTH